MTTNRHKISTPSLVIMALFTAVLCVSAYISIPLPSGIHITVLNFVILIIALIFPLQQSVFIIAVWMLMGCIGLPVFAGGNVGLGYLLGPFGGYNLAFLLVGILLPLLCKHPYHRIYFTTAAVGAALLIDLCGSLWLMLSTRITPTAAFLTGFLPFIPLDLVKAILAAQLVPQFHRVFPKGSLPFQIK